MNSLCTPEAVFHECAIARDDLTLRSYEGTAGHIPLHYVSSAGVGLHCEIAEGFVPGMVGFDAWFYERLEVTIADMNITDRYRLMSGVVVDPVCLARCLHTRNWRGRGTHRCEWWKSRYGYIESQGLMRFSAGDRRD
jgi:hypothetical protein